MEINEGIFCKGFIEIKWFSVADKFKDQVLKLSEWKAFFRFGNSLDVVQPVDAHII